MYDKSHLVTSSQLQCAVLPIGKGGFQALVTAQDVLGVRSQEVGDASVGRLYVLWR